MAVLNIVEPIVPLDNKISQEHLQYVKEKLHQWCLLWFGEKANMTSQDPSKKKGGEQIALYYQQKLLFAINLPVESFLRIMTGSSVNSDSTTKDDELILVFLKHVVFDLLILLGFDENIKNKTQIFVGDSVASSSKYLDIKILTSAEEFNVLVGRSCYAQYINQRNNAAKSTRSPKFSRQELLGDVGLKATVSLPNIKIDAKKLLGLKVGTIINSSNKLINPLPLLVKGNEVTRVFLGKNESNKAIKVSGK